MPWTDQIAANASYVRSYLWGTTWFSYHEYNRETLSQKEVKLWYIQSCGSGSILSCPSEDDPYYLIVKTK